ncbi:MAG: phosphate ABC transporter substrate-binding protein [Phycisphaerae bacterium]|nr:phosphate ABC transporter substrate-binding protein [Phycisphaerae bacterium]
MRTTTIVLSVLCATVLTGCGEAVDPNEPQGFLQTKGSDTIVNAMQETAEEFMKEYPHVFVAVTGGGSGVGIASLINKTTEIATASREMKGKEIEMAEKRGVHPKEIVVAYDGVAVIVNHHNPIDRLTIEDLHDIFTGKVANWSQLGGKDLPIVTLSREVSSGTHMYFKEAVVQLNKKGSAEEFSKETLLLTSSQAIVEEVANNEGAIGYLGMGYLSDRTKAVLVSRVSSPGLEKGRSGLDSSTKSLGSISSDEFFPPTVQNVVNKTYPLSRPLYLYTDGEPAGVTKLFVDFALGPMGQTRFMATGFVPVQPRGGEIQNSKLEIRNKSK